MYIVDYNPCNPDPCTHGQCVASGGTYTCTCNSGYSGTTCDGKITKIKVYDINKLIKICELGTASMFTNQPP
jgi:Notch-like protein